MNTYSGKYKGVPVSVVSIGMGTPMMDFLIREASHLIDGPMAVIRVGTCGSLDSTVVPGTIVVASKGSAYAYRNYLYFDGSMTDERRIDDGEPPAKKSNAKPNQCDLKPYCFTAPVMPDGKLSDLLFKKLEELKQPAANGLNVSGETFYDCQGRKSKDFDDKNEFIVDMLVEHKVTTMEMESHKLFHMGQHRVKAPLKTAACHVAVVSRGCEDGKVPSKATISERAMKAGEAALQALAEIEL
eukprot:GHVU01141018.1.p1 GENE.GHVU01141018.1~~GHVU01141018.1.p1  ORF type:complete len:242 (+),score=43.98 GHVU01141018.1:706-1431(+)